DSGAQSPKQDRSRQRIEEILAAAVRVFARDGIAKARIGDIAADAGVPVASIYDYFSSKEELAYQVPIRLQTQFYREFRDRYGDTPSNREKLLGFLWLSGDFARRNSDWARVLYLEVWPSVLIANADVRHVLDDYGRIVIDLLEQGARDGEWPRQPDPYQTATILIGAMSQLVITWLLYRRPRNLSAASLAMIDRVLSLLDVTSKDMPKRARAARPARVA
ncbi:MAG TPA: TetR/AcrR family transcriptional regulator, partial [Rhizomicrobium sp.]